MIKLRGLPAGGSTSNCGCGVVEPRRRSHTHPQRRHVPAGGGGGGSRSPLSWFFLVSFSFLLQQRWGDSPALAIFSCERTVAGLPSFDPDVTAVRLRRAGVGGRGPFGFSSLPFPHLRSQTAKFGSNRSVGEKVQVTGDKSRDGGKENAPDDVRPHLLERTC